MNDFKNKAQKALSETAGPVDSEEKQSLRIETLGPLREIIKYKEEVYKGVANTPMGHAWRIHNPVGHHFNAIAQIITKGQIQPYEVIKLYDDLFLAASTDQKARQLNRSFLEETLEELIKAKDSYKPNAAVKPLFDAVSDEKVIKQAGLTQEDLKEMQEYQYNVENPSPEVIEERQRTLTKIIREAIEEQGILPKQQAFKAEVLSAHHHHFDK